MKRIKYLFVLCFVFYAVIGLKGGAFGAFTPIGSAFDGIYGFDNGAGWTFDVSFQLWQETDPASADFGLFQYRYQVDNIQNNLGGGLGEFQGIRLSVSGGAVGTGWNQPGDPGETGNFAPIATWPGGNSFQWFFWAPFIPDGGLSTWFWFTSWGEPGLLSALGDGSGVIAQGDLPGPVPEPATILLLGMGILGAGFMRYRRLNAKT